MTYNIRDSEHESILELLNINFRFVRYYYCLKKTNASQEVVESKWEEIEKEEAAQTFVKRNEADRIYLFVNGKLSF